MWDLRHKAKSDLIDLKMENKLIHFLFAWIKGLGYSVLRIFLTSTDGSWLKPLPAYQQHYKPNFCQICQILWIEHFDISCIFIKYIYEQQILNTLKCLLGDFQTKKSETTIPSL